MKAIVNILLSVVGLIVYFNLEEKYKGVKELYNLFGALVLVIFLLFLCYIFRGRFSWINELTKILSDSYNLIVISLASFVYIILVSFFDFNLYYRLLAYLPFAFAIYLLSKK